MNPRKRLMSLLKWFVMGGAHAAANGHSRSLKRATHDSKVRLLTLPQIAPRPRADTRIALHPAARSNPDGGRLSPRVQQNKAACKCMAGCGVAAGGFSSRIIAGVDNKLSSGSPGGSGAAGGRLVATIGPVALDGHWQEVRRRVSRPSLLEWLESYP